MTSSTATTPAVRPLPLKASHATNLHAAALPTSVRGAPPELRRLIRKRQNSESAKRCRLRRKLEAQKDVGSSLTSNQQLEQLQSLVSDLANRLFQTQDIVAALVAHAQHQAGVKPTPPSTYMNQMPAPVINNNNNNQMQQQCKQEAVITPLPQQQHNIIHQQQQQPQQMMPMQQVIQPVPAPMNMNINMPMSVSMPMPLSVAPVPIAQEQKQHVVPVPVQPPAVAPLQPPALADLSDLQYNTQQQQQQLPASPACSSSTISTIENHPDVIGEVAPNTPAAPPSASTEEVGSPFSELNDIAPDFVYSVDLRDLGSDAYNL